MQFRIHFRGERWVPSSRLTRALPGVPEGVEPLPPALGTRSVACGKGHGLVQEEKLRVTARRHHQTPQALELEEASDPTPAFELADDLAFLIVNRPAPVAHQRSTGGGAKNHAAGVHTVL